MSTASDHFFRDVLTVGDRFPLIAAKPIFSSTRIKLVDTGARLSSKTLERILNHKLLEPLEQCLNVEQAVRPDELGNWVLTMLVADGRFGRFAALEAPDRLAAPFSDIVLPDTIALKLTVARELRPRAFLHWVDVALIAVYLAVRSGWPRARLVEAATAGMLHDIGELDISPELFEPGKLLSFDERQTIYSHPVSSSAIVAAQPEYPPAVAQAILDHHERLDGSGYPRQLVGSAISELGKILAAAEVGGALLSRSVAQGTTLAFDVPLRLMWNKLDSRCVTAFTELLAADDRAGAGTGVVAVPHARQTLRTVAKVLAGWSATRTSALYERHGERMPSIVEFLDERIGRLQRTLLDAGLATTDVEGFLTMVGEEPQMQAELAAIAGEARWLLSEVLLETRRRWDQFGRDEPLVLTMVSDWLDAAGARLGATATETPDPAAP